VPRLHIKQAVVMWLIHAKKAAGELSFVTWPTHRSDMTHCNEWHDSFVRSRDFIPNRL